MPYCCISSEFIAITALYEFHYFLSGMIMWYMNVLLKTWILLEFHPLWFKITHSWNIVQLVHAEVHIWRDVYALLFCKGGRDGKYFKVGFLIEALFQVYQWRHIWCVIYLCNGSELPSNLNSDFIHHTTFLSLRSINKIVT